MEDGKWICDHLEQDDEQLPEVDNLINAARHSASTDLESLKKLPPKQPTKAAQKKRKLDTAARIDLRF